MPTPQTQQDDTPLYWRTLVNQSQQLDDPAKSDVPAVRSFWASLFGGRS